MGITVALNHVTHYKYDRSIQLGPQTIRLRPAPHSRTEVPSFSLKIEPENHFINWQQDPFGNYMARVLFTEPTREFRVEVDLVAELKVFNPFDFFLEDQAKQFPFTYDSTLAEELAPYLAIKEEGTRLMEFVRSIDRREQPLLDFLVSVNQRLNTGLKYLVRMEPGVQSCEQTLENQSGSCRDMAWFLCQALRHLGLATRFASGYSIQLKADVKSLEGPSGVDFDLADLHAWTEVYLPGAGWVGLDPTSGLLTGEGHIPLCCTPHPSSAAPITGTLDPCESELNHEMRVTRIQEERRITKPYLNEEWADIDRLGKAVDTILEKEDVRLTMGGEPTFVSAEDFEAEEWKLAALGPQKLKKANQLLKEAWDKFGRGGVVQHGQGKWYPGEILPRWALSCIWRRDGEPLWKNKELIAIDASSKVSDEVAQAFVSDLAHALGVGTETVLPAREDAVFHLWREGQLPVEGDAPPAGTFEETERKRLRTLMEKGLGKPVGYVLPLGFSFRKKKWISNQWEFRSGHLVLTPGDSPIGFRLPMASVPYRSEADAELVPPKSTFESPDVLAPHAELAKAVRHRLDSRSEVKSTEPMGYVRTALCFQVRDGIPYVFLPPVARAGAFADLVASVESVAAKHNVPIRIEGYGPPLDLGLRQFKITPDPGVIEINVHPVESWEEQVDLTESVYEQAHVNRLSAHKFLLDGQRVGTGGGNHIVLGGATPTDSPFLRRPDLLKSLLTFWQNHPSLSYLFSSLFIGPTSQAPRVDEARHESLYELEIALQKINRTEETPLWLIDRLLRNLLVDLTGNTHRAEFCIDKLYNPGSESGRLGLLELRAFEMPPHPKMSLVQYLLVRALIATFWKEPYGGSLIRWGTQLHDRFMLSEYVWSDLVQVTKYLSDRGIDMRSEWFAPHLEFRFPKIGSTEVDGIRLELRSALEPWPVMGEESDFGSVSRGVDSSVERLEIKVSGPLQDHHWVTCNGKRLPLRQAAKGDARVAGVRFKAWAPPSCLHPTIGVHAPLVFDLVDARVGRSLGGCTYHVAHPGGRNYDSIPVNENEAQGRRLARFSRDGHTPGKMNIPRVIENDEFPTTLDLRLYNDEIPTK